MRAANGASAPAPAAPTGRVNGSRRRFPAEYKAIKAPADRLSWLAGKACAAKLEAGQLKPAQVQAEVDRIGAAQREVAPIVPSPARLDDWCRGETFPPPAEFSPMRRADYVLNQVEEPVFWPAAYLSSQNATYDYVIFEDERRRQRIGFGDAESPSAVAHRALADRRGEIRTNVSRKQAEADARELEDYRQAVGAEEFERIRVAFE